MSEEHLDLLSFATGDGVGLGLCDCAGLVASGFMNGARDLARGHVRAAFWLERAGVAVVLAREVDHRAFFRHPGPRFRERAMVLLELFAGGANIAVALWIEGEVSAGKGPVGALGLVEHLHVRLDPALVQPPE